MASRSTAGTTKRSTRAKSESAPDAAKSTTKPELEVVTETNAAQMMSSELKKRELLQLVAARADLSNNKVKPVLEAMLEVLGEAIAEGRELNLQPLGRIKINRQKDAGNARVTIAKIRQSKSRPEDEADEA